MPRPSSPAPVAAPLVHGEKVQIEQSDVVLLEAALRRATFPEDDRTAIVGKGVRVGLSGSGSPVVFVGSWAPLARLANEVALRALTAAGRTATWTSIQFNANTVADEHVDVEVSGLSLILLAGAFCRGAFRCGDLLLRDAGWLLGFRGTAPHSSDEFSGTRFSIVFHSARPGGYPEQARPSLLELGFPLPPAAGPAPSPAPPGFKVTLLYLFAGPLRRDGLADCLRQLAVARGGAAGQVKSYEVDIARDPAGDLTEAELQSDFLLLLADGTYDMVVLSPPCGTWSRSRFARQPGPPPVRDATHPWGLPGLAPARRRECDTANTLLKFSLDVLETVARARRRGIAVAAFLEHPEDLGRAARGRPASIWQLPRLRALVASGDFGTAAFYQCAFGAAHPKPTRFLSNCPSFLALGRPGWPVLSERGSYGGPLPASCGHSHAPFPMGRAPAARAELAAAAAYPAELNRAIAQAAWDDLAGRALLAGDGAGQPALGADPPTTTISTQPQRVHVDAMDSIDGKRVYIGRGCPSRDLPPSRWANPFRVRRFGRQAAIQRFKAYLDSSPSLRAALPELSGAVLVCHCLPDQACHGDVLLRALAESQGPEEEDLDDDGFDDDAGTDHDGNGGSGAGGADADEPDEDSGNPTPSFLGAGPVGRGPPLRVLRRGVPRDVVDGGGLCSPGKWPLSRRCFPQGPVISTLRSALIHGVAEFEQHLKTSDGSGSLRDFVFRAALGRYSASPFPEKLVGTIRDRVGEILRGAGRNPAPRAGDVEQAIDVRLLEALALELRDPDAQIGGMAAVGVRTGALTALPRTPAIFERKVSWPLESEAGQPWSGERLRRNYASAADRPDVLKRQFEQEVTEGLMIKTSLQQARAEWGEHLVIASLAAVEKDLAKDEWRVIYDATHGVNLNHRIRVRDQVRCPAWPDVSRILETCRDDGFNGHFVLAYDVSKAHRRIPIQRSEWGLLACRADAGAGADDEAGEVFLNTCGTFGVASAGYWWSRLAALVVRVLFVVAGRDHPLYQMLYSDDGTLVAAGPRFEFTLVLCLLVLAVLRVPLSWRKLRGGLEVEWVGFLLDVRRFRLGFSERRREWVAAFCLRVASGEPVLVHEVREGLGRLIFVAGPLVVTRPFLGPVFAWVSRCPPGARLVPPPLVRAVLCWFAEILRRHPWKTCSVGHRACGELFRVDAKAEGDDIVVLGGWSTGPAADPSTARWFSHRLSREEAPWAFDKGQPFRVIASLELLAVVFGIVLLTPADPEDRLSSGSAEFSVGTDNQGNEQLVVKWLTAKMPLALVAMELAAQLARRNRTLDLRWRRRDANVEADALTEGRFDGFDPALRVDAAQVTRGLLCLPGLAAQLPEFTAALGRTRPAKRPRRAPGGADRPLRAREPW